MTSGPSFDDIFAVMAAASAGSLAERVAVAEHPNLDDEKTRMALALNILLDDLALRARDAERELTERKRIADRLRAVSEAAHEFSAATYDCDHLLDVVARRIGEAIGDFCGIRITSDDGAWLESTTAVYHPDPTLLALARAGVMVERQRVGDGMSGRVAETAQPLVVSAASVAEFAASVDPKYRAFIERLGVTTSIAVPLICRGTVLGVVELVRNSPGHPYGDDDLGLVQSIAEHAALAIGNARSHAAKRVARDRAEIATSAFLRSERRFSRLCEAGILGTIVGDLDGQVFEVNDTLLELLDCSRDDILSGRIPWNSLTPAAWLEADARAVEQLVTSGVTGLREKELVRKDGTHVPVLTGSAMLDEGSTGCISFVLDLTERNQAQAAVERMRVKLAAGARFRGLLESAPDAMVVAGDDGVIVLVNGQAETLFGYARHELVGQPMELLVPERFRHAHVSHRGGYFRTPSVRSMGVGMDLHARRKDGSEFPIEVSLSPLETEDGVLVSSAIRDITERRRVDRELARAKDVAEAASHELETFSYSVAHDLRAPLRGMNGFARLLLDGYRDRFDAEGRDWLEEILLNARKMSSLIDALLSLSRLTKSELRRESVDLSMMVREAAARLSVGDPQRTVDWLVPDHIRADLDPSLARALVENLVGNAWKFTSRTTTARIELGTTEKNGSRAIFVRDNGAGFDMAYAGKLFAPFQRLHTAGEFPGTGIGLATVQRIVHRHGGRVWAEGTVGAGATIYFTLPPPASGPTP